MTQILNLPQLSGEGTIFEVITNADWSDTIFFPALSSPVSSTLTGSMIEASNQVTVSSTLGLSVGQGIAGPGIPDGAYIDAVISSTELTMVDSDGFVLYATATNTGVPISFSPVGLDLRNIEFVANLRIKASLYESILTVRTTDGTFINGGIAGTLAFNIPESVMETIPPMEYVMDIVAIAEDQYVNLFPQGPATVIVLDGVTDPDTLTP